MSGTERIDDKPPKETAASQIPGKHVYDEVLQGFDALSKQNKEAPKTVIENNKGSFKDEFGTIIQSSSPNDISLNRKADSSFKFSTTKDGSQTYEYKGITENDKYTCAIKPDGKGGYFINWKGSTPNNFAADKEELNIGYHWQPNQGKSGLLVPSKQLPSTSEKREGGGGGGSSSEHIKEHSPVKLFDNGRGLHVSRRSEDVIDDNGKVKLSTHEYDLNSTDAQGSRMVFKENGELVITDKNNNSLELVPLETGYSINSVSPDGKVIGSESVNNGEKITFDENTHLTVTHKRDGITETVKTNDDGTYSKWTTYKEGGFCYQHFDPKGDKNYLQDSKDVRTKATQEQARLEKEYSARFSKGTALGDPPFNFDGIPFETRAHVLKELQAMERVLEKYPLDAAKGKNISFIMLNGKSLPVEGVAGGYNDNRIILNPTANRDHYLHEADWIYDPASPNQSVEAVVMHEMSHAIADRHEPKLRDPDSKESIELGKKYGFARISDQENEEGANAHESKWVIECEDPNSDKGETAYYKLLVGYAKGAENLEWARVNLSGKFLDSKGKVVDTVEKAAVIGPQKLTEIAKVKLPTFYAYASPMEAEAEVHTALCINEASRENLLLTSESVYDQAVLDDQNYIDREKPDYMRIPSGKIVPKSKENEELVAEFKRRTLEMIVQKPD